MAHRQSRPVRCLFWITKVDKQVLFRMVDPCCLIVSFLVEDNANMLIAMVDAVTNFIFC